jgi:hypothetical protein
MQPIPLIRRLLFYLVLLPISLIVSYLFGISLIIFGNTLAFYIFVSSIAHYIFSAIFIKAKLIIKLIVPLAIALVSFACIEVSWNLDIFDRYGFWGSVIQMFLIFAILWEIAYQILKYRK